MLRLTEEDRPRDLGLKHRRRRCPAAHPKCADSQKCQEKLLPTAWVSSSQAGASQMPVEKPLGLQPPRPHLEPRPLRAAPRPAPGRAPWTAQGGPAGRPTTASPASPPGARGGAGAPTGRLLGRRAVPRPCETVPLAPHFHHKGHGLSAALLLSFLTHLSLNPILFLVELMAVKKYVMVHVMHTGLSPHEL